MKQYDDAELKRLAKAVGWRLDETIGTIASGYCDIVECDPKSGITTLIGYGITPKTVARTLAVELRRLAGETDTAVGVYNATKGVYIINTISAALHEEASSLEAWAKEQEKPKEPTIDPLAEFHEHLTTLRVLTGEMERDMADWRKQHGRIYERKE